MPRPFTRAQALQNAAFLGELRRTGNARDAARTLGLHRATLIKRRKTHPAFAADWDAALAVANASLIPPPEGEGGGAATSGLPGASRSREAGSPSEPWAKHGGGVAARSAASAEPRTVRLKSGRLQLRRAQPGRLTRTAEQAFLAALSATANVRLSAAAAGFSHSAFYYRAKRNPGFAREMRLALETGCERLECALLESTLPGAHADDAWRHNDPPAIPPMTAEQALQLLHLHNKTAHALAEPPHLKRRRGESADVWSFRLAAMAAASRQRDRDAYAIAEAARRAGGKPSPFEPAPPSLPDLAQVTGWSKAAPIAAGEDAAVSDRHPHGLAPESRGEHEQARTENGFVRERGPGLALFGGWRVKGR